MNDPTVVHDEDESDGLDSMNTACISLNSSTFTHDTSLPGGDPSLNEFGNLPTAIMHDSFLQNIDAYGLQTINAYTPAFTPASDAPAQFNYTAMFGSGFTARSQDWGDTMPLLEPEELATLLHDDNSGLPTLPPFPSNEDDRNTSIIMPPNHDNSAASKGCPNEQTNSKLKQAQPKKRRTTKAPASNHSTCTVTQAENAGTLCTTLDPAPEVRKSTRAPKPSMWKDTANAIGDYPGKQNIPPHPTVDTTVAHGSRGSRKRGRDAATDGSNSK